MDEKYKNDLNYFLECAEQYHLCFYHSHSKNELKEYINNYLTNNKVNNEYQLLYMLKNIIKYMSSDKDSHTRIDFEQKTYLPLDFIFIENFLFINSSFDEKFNKAKVLKINNIPINQLISELESIISYSNKEWFERNIELELKKVQTLSILPSINAKINKIEILTDKGLLSIDLNKEYIKNKQKNEQYEIINKTLIVKYKSCDEKSKPNIKEVEKIINNNDVRCIAIDMRNNSGGNESILKEFIDYLTTKNINVDVIVNKGVFSAARWTIIDLINIGANVIGEKIGTPLNCFGSRNIAGVTPNFHYKMIFSKWYILYDEISNKISVINSKEKYNELSREVLNNKYLNLNKEILYTIDDYLNNIDPIKNYYLNKKF